MFEHVAPVQVATGTPDSQVQGQNTKPWDDGRRAGRAASRQGRYTEAGTGKQKVEIASTWTVGGEVTAGLEFQCGGLSRWSVWHVVSQALPGT